MLSIKPTLALPKALGRGIIYYKMNNLNSITELARELRNNPTPAERKLWHEIRKRQLNNCKFLRQRPIIYNEEPKGKLNFFIADFYCADRKLVIELDGRIHRHQKNYDQQRDLILKKKGLNVLRIENYELNNIDKVKKVILMHLS